MCCDKLDWKWKVRVYVPVGNLDSEEFWTENGLKIAHYDAKEIEAVAKYGDYLGLAFQLVDDLMDNDPTIDTGKTKGSDIEKGKSTYLSIYGYDKCKELVAEYTQKAVDALECFGEKAECLPVGTLEQVAALS